MKRLSYVIGGWLLLSLFLYVKTRVEGRPQAWMIQDASEYAVWALLALVLYPLIYNTALKPKAWLKLLPALVLLWHFGGSLAHTAEETVHLSLVHEGNRQQSAMDVVRKEFPRQITRPQYRHLGDFLGLFSICLILVMISNSREREVEHSRLKTQLTDAKLNALRAQMHPHFLFNTLNTVATLATTNSQEAVEVLSQLSDLLRRAAAAEESHFTTISQEFSLLHGYVNIMQHRFGDRVNVTIDYDPDLDQVLVPVLTLQPLVENAYTHGVGPRLSGGAIHVSGTRTGDRVTLAVTDDGIGNSATPSGTGQGMALENIRDRLSHLYHGKAHLETTYPETGGYTVVVSLPLIHSEEEIQQS